MKKPNTYRIEGDVAFIALANRQGETIAECKVDAADLDSVLGFPYRWAAVGTNGSTRLRPAAPSVRDGKLTTVYLYRFILCPPDGYVVDHINGDTLDNRRINLRVVTDLVNHQNNHGARRHSRSGVRNCLFRPEQGKYVVRFRVDGKYKCFGRFSDIREADQLAQEIRLKLYGLQGEALIVARENGLEAHGFHFDPMDGDYIVGSEAEAVHRWEFEADDCEAAHV